MNHIDKVKEYIKLCEENNWKEVGIQESEEMRYVTSTGFVKLRENWGEIYDLAEDCMYVPDALRSDKIYKIYNASDSSFYIKDDDGYGDYGVTRIHSSSVFLLEPVDSSLVSAITEYEALVLQAKQLLANSGIEMLSPDVEKQINWDSSSLDC